jgi:hypothetical protein
MSVRCTGAASFQNLGVDAGEVDLLVEPPPDLIVAGVGGEVRKATDVFVVARLQPIAPDHFHGALLAAIVRNRRKSRAG